MREFNPLNIPIPRISDFSSAPIAPSSMDLEIGAGQGLHAIRYCQANPERLLCAIERTEGRFNLLRSRQRTHPQLKNLYPVRADAIAYVVHFVADSSLERVFLLYPNPYPKMRQANRRWHRSPFIHFLHRKMKPGATLNLATNLKWYADEAESLLTASGLFSLKTRQIVSANTVPRTHFEAKYLARGETCFDLIFEKELQ